MKLKLWQVDAFSEKVLGGNPAAIVPLAAWIDDGLMQKIANENNLAETAFFVRHERRQICAALVHAGGRGRSLRTCHACKRVADLRYA